MRGLVILLILAVPTHAAFCPSASEQSGGMTDVMLLYAQPNGWPVEHLRPYVAYLDKRTGKARDWFFDGWLFLMYAGAPSKETYITGATNKADWLHFLDLIWQSGGELHALNDCIAQVGRELSDPGKVYPVIIMIPYPSTQQGDFGDVNGDGQSEDLSRPQDRTAAVGWFVDEVLHRWQGSQFAHLKLWGFYWMNEGISQADEEIVRQTAEFVHRRGCKMHWIPWHAAPGYDKWRELGLDFVVMQPNFAFVEPTGGLRLPNEDRLTDNANRARAIGLGVEMELNGGETRRPESRWNLRQYLNHGVDELDGYMKGAARAWYQDYSFVRDLYESDSPECNELYDDIYRFHKGTYRRRVVSQAEGCRCIVSPGIRDGKKLTDGLWVTNGTHLERAIRVRADRVRLLLDLGAEQLVEDVRVHLVGGSFPCAVRVSTGASHNSLSLAGQSDEMPLKKAGDYLAGFVAVPFPARVSRYVEVELLSPTPIEMMVDEIVVPPAGHLLWGAQYLCEGTTPIVHRTGLTDGLCGPAKVRWRGAGKVMFKVEQPCYARCIRAHFTCDGAPLKATALINGEAHELTSPSQGREGWTEAAIPVARVRDLQLLFEASGEFACDEVQLVPAVNLALGRPYTLDPPFPATYPDSGAELTDGMLTENGFGDGKTVGWVHTSPEVTIDLGGLQKVDAARVHVEGGGHGWVNFPERITVSTSLNSDTWSLVASGRPEPELTSDKDLAGNRLSLAWMTLRFRPTQARFVRLHFTTTGWTMLSEVEVLREGVNVARGTKYTLRPFPTCNTRYADNASVLTDGRYSSAGWTGCAGWDKADPTITVDLQGQKAIAAVSAHLAGGGPGGVFFPKSVAFSVSDDGQSWRDLSVVTDRPEETGNAVVPGSMGLSLEPAVEARYVRVHLERRGWVMVDEVEVMSP